jgi:CRISPR-associated endonuclease/helicase Cas3
VSIHQRDAQRLLAQADIEELIPGLFVQVSSVLYDPVLGLLTDYTAAPASAWIVSGGDDGGNG